MNSNLQLDKRFEAKAGLTEDIMCTSPLGTRNLSGRMFKHASPTQFIVACPDLSAVLAQISLASALASHCSFSAIGALERQQRRSVRRLGLLRLPHRHAEHPLPNRRPLVVLRSSPRREHLLHRRRAELPQQIVPLGLAQLVPQIQEHFQRSTCSKCRMNQSLITISTSIRAIDSRMPCRYSASLSGRGCNLQRQKGQR